MVDIMMALSATALVGAYELFLHNKHKRICETAHRAVKNSKELASISIKKKTKKSKLSL